MTSNLGNEVIQSYSIGFSDNGKEESERKQRRDGEMKEKIDKILKENFKLEFLNRIDEVVVFKSLTKETLSKIVEELNKLATQAKQPKKDAP